MSTIGRIVNKILGTQGLVLTRTVPVNVPITSAAIPPPQVSVDRCELLFEIAVANGRYSDRCSLSAFGAQVYSQNGEDGMIATAFQRIGEKDRFFVEIGIETGTECNTRLLLEQGWRGVWVDGGEANIAKARENFAGFIEAGALTLCDLHVTADNINDCLDHAGVPSEFDFLSLDVDYNTSHIWRAITRRCRVACVEYNASLPASVALEVPYDAAKMWDGTNWFGASLKALEQIGTAKGMHLVGCDLHGTNGFFVAESETFDRFLQPYTAETHWEPPRYHLIGRSGHPPSPHARQWVRS